MHYWYEAVCEKHKERCAIFMTHGVNSDISLPYDEKKASEFLAEHYGCELYLIWRDDQLDIVNDKEIYQDDFKKMYKK